MHALSSGCAARHVTPGRSPVHRRRLRAGLALSAVAAAISIVADALHLIVTREENLSDRQREDLHTMLEYVPALRTLRKFVKAIHRLFETDQSEHQAWCRRSALLRCQEFQSVPELAQVIEMLSEPPFRKMIAFLRGPANRRVMVRTNNHVERCNRKLRFLEKVRYKWRRPRTLVRFMVLAMDHVWKATLPTVPSCKRKRRPSPTPGAQAA